MAKTPKNNSKNTIAPTRPIDYTLRLSPELVVKVIEFKKHLGVTTEQDAIRVALTRFFVTTGF